jgi:serine/threonine-protein kinase
MATASLADFVQAVTRAGLLDTGQQQELGRLRAAFREPRALAGELVKRGWLTPFQVNQLFKPTGQRLRVGPFILLDRLGAGGMGEVFRARNYLTGQVVALKVIREGHAEDPDAGPRFLREIRAVTALAHPNIVSAFHADQDGGTLYLVMEYVEGMDLTRLVRQRGPLPVAEACAYVRQAALGLQHAHERGLVHRDIKPSNLLLSRTGALKLLDLGLARSAAMPGSQGMTQTGTVLGTPDYLAPEQALDARAADARSDIYSLGCTLYFLLTGRPPFPEGSLAQKLLWHQQAQPTPLESLRRDLPAGLGAVVRRMMAKRPQDRFPAAAELAAALLPFCPPVAVPVTAVPAGKVTAASRASHPGLAPASLVQGAAVAPEHGWTLTADSTPRHAVTVPQPGWTGSGRGFRPWVRWLMQGKRPLILAGGAGALLLLVVLLVLLGRSGSSATDAGKGKVIPPPIPVGPLTVEMIDKLGVKRKVQIVGASTTLNLGVNLEAPAVPGAPTIYRVLLDQGHGIVLSIPWDAIRKIQLSGSDYVVTVADGTEHVGSVQTKLVQTSFQGADGNNYPLTTLNTVTVLSAGKLPGVKAGQTAWTLSVPAPADRTYHVFAPRFAGQLGGGPSGKLLPLEIGGEKLTANVDDFQRVAVAQKDGNWTATVTAAGGGPRTAILQNTRPGWDWWLGCDLADGSLLVLTINTNSPGFVLERRGGNK